jgi:RNA polymerase sigma-70 factor (ECF subfamily)
MVVVMVRSSALVVGFSPFGEVGVPGTRNWAPTERPVPGAAVVSLFRTVTAGKVAAVTGWCDSDVVATDLLARARAGDSDAFSDLVEPHRRELHVHCYRMLGSVHDADDALQETLLAAWRGLAEFEGRSSLRTWLYRIATHRSLDLLRSRKRSPMTSGLSIEPPEPSRLGEVTWLEPYPDRWTDLVDRAPGPDAVVESREATSLAYVVALQLLPARQRAVLLLRDVLGYRASEVAAMIETTEEGVTSALKRARAAVARHLADPDRSPVPRPTPDEQQVAATFMAAFEAQDVDAMVALLSEDARIAMPPLPLEYLGRAAAAAFLGAVNDRPRRVLRSLPTRANGCPAFATYQLDGGVWRSIGLFVVTVGGGGVRDVTHFEPDTLAAFGLPLTMAERDAG